MPGNCGGMNKLTIKRCFDCENPSWIHRSQKSRTHEQISRRGSVKYVCIFLQVKGLGDRTFGRGRIYDTPPESRNLTPLLRADLDDADDDDETDAKNVLKYLVDEMKRER